MIIVYAEDKDGYVSKIGEYEQIEDVEIRTSLFKDGTRITLVEKFEREPSK
jgi:hypothetical protein